MGQGGGDGTPTTAQAGERLTFILPNGSDEAWFAVFCPFHMLSFHLYVRVRRRMMLLWQGPSQT